VTDILTTADRESITPHRVATERFSTRADLRRTAGATM
jgi:hypothetical protein